MISNITISLCVAVTLGFALYTTKILLVESAQAREYKLTYELIRAEHEGFLRTIGRSVDNAYVCKIRK